MEDILLLHLGKIKIKCVSLCISIMRLKLCWFMVFLEGGGGGGGGGYVGKYSEVNIFLIYHVSSGSGASSAGLSWFSFRYS